MATIKEVARLAGVSSGTVSNYLRGSVRISAELRNRIESAIKELDYQPDEVARSLKSRQTKTLGLVIPDASNTLFPEVARGAADASLKHGYLLTTFTTNYDPARERELLSALRGRKVDGILFASENANGNDLREALSRGANLVAVDRVPKGLAIDAVTMDNLQGARDAVLHLAAIGRQRIALLSRPPVLSCVRDRIAGYMCGLRSAGLPVTRELREIATVEYSAAYEAAMNLLKLPHPPDAIFATNGTAGHGALRAIRERKMRCPEDVALAIVDDIEIGKLLMPPVTAVVQPAYELGRVAADLLISRLRDKAATRAPVRIRLPVQLIVRESTAGKAEGDAGLASRNHR